MTDTSAASAARRWIGFTAMALGMFLAILDIQIVSSSLIDIQADLSIPAQRLSYLQTTYLIAEVIAIALTGWLTRALSTRWLFVIAMVGFVAASAACAASNSYLVLYGFRFVQGLFGGAVIPLIFSAAFAMFPPREQALATVIGGGFAMLAPSTGPLVGGWITETWSWHWLFLINIIPGLAVAATAAWLVRVDEPRLERLKTFDPALVGLLALFLTTLELTLKEAPRLGWFSLPGLALSVLCAASGVAAARLSLRRRDPVVDLNIFRSPCFATGALLSFVLGMALFGGTYLLPLFLGLVRDYGPLDTGAIMIITGIAQLAAAPVATLLERKASAALLTAAGYGLLAVGLAWNGFADYTWDARELAMPQILRGAAFMLCLLPATRLALDGLSGGELANASALFNLMRNIGGAVGLALIDTVIENRPAHHVARMVERLQAGDRATAAFVGLPVERFHGTPMGPIDEATKDLIEPLVRRAALVASLNEAWLLLAGLVVLSLAVVPLMRSLKTSADRAAASMPHSQL